jgi:proton-translocating NADH-quinone oxidoreductase chain N
MVKKRTHMFANWEGEIIPLAIFQNDVYSLFPELFLTVIILICLVFGVIWSTSKVNHTYPVLTHTVAWLGVWTLFCTWMLSMHMPFTTMVSFHTTIVIDPLTTLLKTMVLFSAAAAMLMSLDYLKSSLMNVFEYSILVLFSTLSMLHLISSYDFITMYLAIEMQSLCFYALAASKRHSEFSTEAGLKYFLLGAFSSGILLFGCSLIYGFAGSTNFEDMAKTLAASYHLECDSSLGYLNNGETIDSLPRLLYDYQLVHVGMCLIAVAFLFKLTAAPFHFWATDVYEGAPTSVTAFFSITPKIALLGVFMRLLLFCFYDMLFSWQYVIFFCSACSLLMGAFGAMAQRKIKRLLVFSSVGHIGYLLMGLSCGTVEGLQAVLLYLLIYVVMTVNIFTALLACVDENNTFRVKYIQDFGLLGSAHPVLAVSMSATLFSMAGIPPLAGFFSKFYLIFAAMGSSLFWLGLLAVLCSVLSCFYYIRMIKTFYFEQPSQRVTFKQMDHEKAILLGLTTFFIVFFSLCPQSLFLWTYKIAYIFVG